jgi:hypothetical protein
MSDSESVEDVQYKVTKDFRKNVLKWIELDDNARIIKSRIKELNEKVKEFNEEKKKYEEPIIGYLTKVDEDGFLIKDGKISKNVSKVKAPLKKELIHKALVELVHDTNKAMTMTDHIINSRPTVEKINLKRIKAREPKK